MAKIIWTRTNLEDLHMWMIKQIVVWSYKVILVSSLKELTAHHTYKKDEPQKY